MICYRKILTINDAIEINVPTAEVASIFSKIAAGEIPSYKCAESDKFYAFLDISQMCIRDRTDG